MKINGTTLFISKNSIVKEMFYGDILKIGWNTLNPIKKKCRDKE